MLFRVLAAARNMGDALTVDTSLGDSQAKLMWKR